MGIGKDGFLAVAPSAPPTPSRGIIIIIIYKIPKSVVNRLEQLALRQVFGVLILPRV